MVDKISVEIGLEGGDEVTRQLEDIGKAGEQTFSSLTQAADQVDFSNIADGLNSVKSAAQNAASLEQLVQGVKKVEGAFDALGTAVGRMATRMTRSLGLLGVLARSLGPVGIAVGVVGGAIVKFGNDSAKALSEVTAEAAKLGLTAQQLQILEKAFTSLGVSSEAVTTNLDKLKNLIGGGLDRLGDIAPPDATTRLQQFIAQLEAMPDGVKRTQLAMQTLGDTLGGQVIAGLQTGTISAQNFAAALGQVTPATQQQIIDAAKYEQALNQLNAAWTELKGAFSPIVTPVFQFLTEELKNLRKDIEEIIKEFQFLKAVFDVFNAPEAGKAAAADRAAEAWKQIGQTGQDAGQKTAAAFGQTVAPIQQTTAAANETTQALIQTGDAGEEAGKKTKRAMDEAKRAAQEAADAAVQLANTLALAWTVAGAQQQAGAERWARTGQGLQQFGAHAQGGLLGGRGTGTSDSNLAWVSRGEYITPARAVAQPGVLGFLEALRRSGGNLSRVLDGMSHFALGGMVPRMPAFAVGGLAGPSNHVTIQFPGLPAISGLRASSDVVDQLHKAAALAQVRSGGRKPSRYS